MFKTIIATIAATVAVADPVVLDGSNFKSLVWDGEKTNKDTNGNGWFVKFYAPWCGHCKKLAPTWAEFADTYASEVNVAHMDCTEESSKAICAEMGVKGYPDLLPHRRGIRQPVLQAFRLPCYRLFR